jgi:hypothetical protein
VCNEKRPLMIAMKDGEAYTRPWLWENWNGHDTRRVHHYAIRAPKLCGPAGSVAVCKCDAYHPPRVIAYPLSLS